MRTFIFISIKKGAEDLLKSIHIFAFKLVSWEALEANSRPSIIRSKPQARAHMGHARKEDQ